MNVYINDKRTTVLGSRLPGKDILLGFDIFNQVRLLRITPRGIEYRRMFKPFVQIERLFLTQSTEEVQSLIEDLKARSCAESHEDFLSKCDHPLWQNPEFYVKLPFKKNEDINPTKASHTGMNPEHQKLAIAECSELLQQGLIEPSDSQWACEAFYVNKRSEQARGKLRLIFSTFDLKAGFWQLGIDPTDRPKTGFCIPNQHYQWKVMPFGLKTAPSLFQKAMIRIFQPIMDQALIYIDDILLFSQDEEAHLKLLQRFSQLLVQYGIMLSERKMKINQKEIEFLGMNLKEGKYQPGPHIAQELIKFPEKDLSKKQILQFLGIVNYLRDFIPKISKYTNPLRKMLKKDPPQWSNAQTKAVKILKDKLQQLPPLKIPSDGKRVLQTDASDKYWGAILFEEKDKKRQLCGYKSGRFTDAEIHYHSTFKEILAVKRAIAKFEYHLIGHHFLVEMDMSSFPQMLKFKQKTVPHPQLLRWSEWFSKYSFDCRHIKGKTNVLADLLTRPKQNKSQIMMLRPSSSKDKVPKKRQKENPETAFDIPPNLNPEFPPEVYRLVMENRFHAKARDMIFEYQLDIFRDYGGLMLNPLGLHPDYPFIHPIHFEVEEVPDEVKWLLWYLTHIHQIAIQFVLPDLQYFVDEAIQGTEPAICRNLGTILKWFFPLPHWKDLIKQAVEQDQGHFIIIILYKPQYFIQHGNAKQLGTFPSAHVHSVQWEDIRKREDRYRALQKHLCQINRQIPKEIWPPPEKEAPWDVWPSNPELLTPYHRSIMEAQQQYKDNIPDPSEWSQDYPWYDSNASKMTKEDDYMETEEGNDSTSTDSAQTKKIYLEKIPTEDTGAAKEQFVTLEIPSTFPKGWIEAGYSHIHFGAIRLALNYHGAEGKPIIARIALLDTRFLKYQDACIGTVEATMNNGLVMVTLFPDFTMALVDPNLMDALKVQIHIIGAPQVESSIIATLHYQIVYRVQDHSFKLSKGGPTESPLPLITVNTQEQPHCVGIPRKISRDELIQLLPESWVTSYEQTHATRQPVRSTETKITSKSDGTSEIKFDHSHLKEQQTPPIFHTQIMMMLPRGDPTAQHDKENPKDCWCDLCHPGAESRMIEKWDAEGKPILFWKDPVTGHCPWNEDCSCEQCVEFNFDQELEGSRHTSYKPHKRRSKKKNSIDADLYERWQAGDPNVGPLGEDNGKFVFLVDYGPRKNRESQILESSQDLLPPPPPSNPPIKPCYKKMYRWIEKRPQEKKWIEKKVAIQANSKPQTERICMFSATGPSYNKDFPPLEEFTEKEYRHAAKIPSLPGEKKISAAEATLNWQTENALAQNATLKRIDARVTQMDSKITMVESKVDSNTKIAHELIVALHKNLERAEKRTIEPGQDIWSYVEQKQQETILSNRKYNCTQPSIFDKRYSQPPEPRRLAPYELRDLIRKQEAEQKRERDERERKGKRNEEDEPMPKVSKALMIQEQQSANPLTSFLKEYKETTIPRILALNTDEQEQSESEESSGSYESESPKSTSEGEVFMTNPGVKTEDDPMDDEASPSTTTPPLFQVNNGKQVFTIDDIPSDRWAQRFQEFQAWMDTQKLTRESNYEILTEFVSRLTGTLRDWWTSVGEADQVTFLTRQSFAEIIKLLHTIFLGNQEDVKTLKRREFFKRKCCSTERKHLQKHFTIMTKLFYILGADINLKHTILASIPEILQNAITSHLQNRGRRIEELTIGEIQQETFMAIEELCEKRKVVKDFLQGSKQISRSCRDDKFQIKCKQKEDCKCRQHKQRRFTRYSFRPPAYPKSLRRKRKWRYLRKKQPQGQKSSKCYICGKQGHFAKRCPKNRHGAKMMLEIQRKTGIQISEEDDVESIFSIDDEPTEDSIFAIQSLAEVPDDSTSNSELSSSDAFMLQARVSPSDSDKLTIPTPHIPVSVYCEKYDKAIEAIAFIDTGAGKTIMNPDILPETWLSWDDNRYSGFYI
ncbi:hypothetical protein GQ457_18G021790 [Hibiscus cannabinus]